MAPMLTIHDTLTTDRAASPEPDTVPLRVLVADDRPLYRQGIVRALESSGAFEVTDEASDGTTALALIRRHEPDVALLDVRMLGTDGIDVVAALARYVSKTADRDVICRDVLAAARAHETRSPSAIHGSADLVRGGAAGWTPRLTSHEHRLLRLADAGWDKPELAFLTGLDEPTVRRRLDSILAKLGADDLTEALSIARARNIIR